jgi:hypothetical protein
MRLKGVDNAGLAKGRMPSNYRPASIAAGAGRCVAPAPGRGVDLMTSTVRGSLPTRRACAVAALSLLWLNAATCHDEPKWDPPGIPSVEQVDVIPGTIHAAAGTSFQLEARVLSTAGRVIDIGDYPQITIEWTSTTPNLFVDATANPVLINVPNSPGTTITDIKAVVTRKVKRPHWDDVSVKENTPAAQIKIAPDRPEVGTPSNSDWFHVEYVPAQFPVVVLLDAGEGANCVGDLTLAVVQTAFLERNLIQTVVGCTPEFAVFATGREMRFSDKASDIVWTANTDDEQTEDPLPESAFRSVGVFIGIDQDTGQVVNWVSEEIKRVAAYLDTNRVGIRFFPAGVFVHGHMEALDQATACKTETINAYLASDHDITLQPDLFVVFVPEITSQKQGFACLQVSGQVGRVIYLSWKQYLPTTAVHEVGHMLSLMAPWIGSGNGHANAIGSFRQDNLMWNSTDLEIRAHRSRFSIGQIFRMNLHTESWLNRILDATQLMVRDCQTATGAGVCPAIDKEPGGP